MNIPEQENPTLLKPLVEKRPLNQVIVTVVFLVTILLGSLSGFLLAGTSKSNSSLGNNSSTSEKSSGTVVGSSDTELYKDCAKGELVKNDGKITDEGSHKLIRVGGESQSVYLTSSVVDLDSFLNKTVEVCGETQKAQRAGWLMDVGIVKLQ